MSGMNDEKLEEVKSSGGEEAFKTRKSRNDTYVKKIHRYNPIHLYIYCGERQDGRGER